MAKTATGFNQAGKKNSTVAKVLPPKMPPKAAMSPAVNNVKANNLISSVNSGITKPMVDTPLKDGMYYAGPTA